MSKAMPTTEKTVTDVLAKAMENADKMKQVVVFYVTHDEDENPGGFFTNEGTTLETLNYLTDLVKHWIFYDR